MVQIWYSESTKYNYEQPGFSFETGHFTQVVWKVSKQLGIGYASQNNNFVVVALYDPVGDRDSEFPANVERPLS